MLVVLVILDCFMAKSLMCLLLGIWMLIELENFYVGTNLVAWMSKKQNFVSLSTVEAEYIAVGSFCSQILWMKKLLGDYGLPQETMLSIVIILVLLISIRIRYNILRPNI